MDAGDLPHPGMVGNIRNLYGSSIFRELAACLGGAMEDITFSFKLVGFSRDACPFVIWILLQGYSGSPSCPSRRKVLIDVIHSNI